jgi:hypothetical protein
MNKMQFVLKSRIKQMRSTSEFDFDLTNHEMKPECPWLKLSRHFTAHLLTIIGAVFLPIG